MNEELIKNLKLSTFKQELLECLKNPEHEFFINNSDGIKFLQDQIDQKFSSLSGNGINIKKRSTMMNLENEYMNKQIEQQEQFLRLMGYEKEWFNDKNLFFDSIKECSQREHFSYLREPIEELGEVPCCNYIDSNQIKTRCSENFGFKLRKGPAFQNNQIGFCICCTREIINSIHLRKFIKETETIIPLNKFRYKYDMKSDFFNYLITVKFGNEYLKADTRYSEELIHDTSGKKYLKFEEMTFCDENEYSSPYGYIQEDPKNYGIEGFYPHFDKNYFKPLKHKVLVTERFETDNNNNNNNKNKQTQYKLKLIKLYETNGLREFFFFRRITSEKK